MQTTSVEQRSFGAYTNLEQLISYQASARHLSMHRNKRAIKHLAGPYQSLIRGRGMEFDSVRLYQAGDDVRMIDWRVSARVGKTHIKQFREERERPVLLVVDQRQSLFFGSQKATKSVVVADLAAYIAWASLHKGDKVGGLVFNDQEQQEIRLRAQRKNVLHLLQTISDYNQQLNYQACEKKNSWKTVLQDVQRLSKPGSQVFLLSDFHDMTADTNDALFRLSRHCDVSAIQVYDPLEQQLPKKGVYAVFSTQNEKLLQSQKHQQQWQQYFAQQQAALKQQFGQFGIPLIPASTQDNPWDVLQAYFGAKR